MPNRKIKIESSVDLRQIAVESCKKFSHPRYIEGIQEILYRAGYANDISKVKIVIRNYNFISTKCNAAFEMPNRIYLFITELCTTLYRRICNWKLKFNNMDELELYIESYITRLLLHEVLHYNQYSKYGNPGFSRLYEIQVESATEEIINSSYASEICDLYGIEEIDRYNLLPYKNSPKYKKTSSLNQFYKFMHRLFNNIEGEENTAVSIKNKIVRKEIFDIFVKVSITTGQGPNIFSRNIEPLLVFSNKDTELMSCMYDNISSIDDIIFECKRRYRGIQCIHQNITDNDLNITVMITEMS